MKLRGGGHGTPLQTTLPPPPTARLAVPRSFLHLRKKKLKLKNRLLRKWNPVSKAIFRGLIWPHVGSSRPSFCLIFSVSVLVGWSLHCGSHKGALLFSVACPGPRQQPATASACLYWHKTSPCESCSAKMSGLRVLTMLSCGVHGGGEPGSLPVCCLG